MLIRVKDKKPGEKKCCFISHIKRWIVNVSWWLVLICKPELFKTNYCLVVVVCSKPCLIIWYPTNVASTWCMKMKVNESNITTLFFSFIFFFNVANSEYLLFITAFCLAFFFFVFFVCLLFLYKSQTIKTELFFQFLLLCVNIESIKEKEKIVTFHISYTI